MAKVQIGTLRKNEADLLLWLQEQEVIHITNTDESNALEEGTRNTEIDFQLAQIKFALEFAKRVREGLKIVEKKSFKNMFVGKPAATLERLEQALRVFNIEKILKEAKKSSKKLADINSRQQVIKDTLKDLSPWRGLDITAVDLNGTDKTEHFLIVISGREELLFKEQLQKIKTAVWQEVNRITAKKNTKIYLELASTREEGESLRDLIGNTNAELITLSLPSDVTLSEYETSLRAEDDQLTTKTQQIFKSSESIIKLEKELKFAYDALLHRQERENVSKRISSSSIATVVTGWVPKTSLEKLEKALSKEFLGSAIEEIKPDKEESPPVAFRNSKLMRPFEVVTDIYGKPKYHELDPTPILSIFFLVAFGLALTDAGYGIVMMITMWAAEKFMNLKTDLKKMVRLLFYAGGATTILGALTGGWFGINLNELQPSTIRDLLLSFRVIDPISEPMTLLMVAFSVGVIQLLFAWVVKGYDNYRNKDYAAMLFDNIAWIAIVVFLLLWVGTTRGILPANLEKGFLTATLTSAAVLVLTQGRQHKNPLLRIGVGVLSLYGLIGFLSDTLSYSRLLALGLATGIIGLVVNLIASMVIEMVPGVGWLLAVVVLLGGHLFNLGINALGAFIHSGRLQFVEFFPKFIEGGGVPYKPFGRVSKYVDNPNDFVN